DLKHRVSVRRLLEGLAELGAVEQLGNVGKRVQMLLKLALRDKEKHDQIHRLVVQGVEINSPFRAAQSAHDLVDQIGRGMRYSDAKADPRAHGGLPLFDYLRNGLMVLGLDFAGSDQVIDEFVNGLPAVAGLQVSQDLLSAQNIA